LISLLALLTPTLNSLALTFSLQSPPSPFPSPHLLLLMLLVSPSEIQEFSLSQSSFSPIGGCLVIKIALSSRAAEIFHNIMGRQICRRKDTMIGAVILDVGRTDHVFTGGFIQYHMVHFCQNMRPSFLARNTPTLLEEPLFGPCLETRTSTLNPVTRRAQDCMQAGFQSGLKQRSSESHSQIKKRLLLSRECLYESYYLVRT